MSRRYCDAAAKLQQNVQKYLQGMEEVSSSDDDEPIDSRVLDGVLQKYDCGQGDTHTLKRTINLLEESIQGRNITCLICIGSIKRIDAVWSCVHCFSSFHLSCIKKWSNDSINLKSEENHGPISVCKPKKIEWCCPKCRHTYTKEEVPHKYKCFCGKLDDPPFQPWLLPHSCGEVCEKRLSTGDNCKHLCLLLCHPGPCPPCPQTIRRVCFCGNVNKQVRCSASQWSCGKKCNKLLSCKTHKCANICHDGECSPCTYTSIQPCQCGFEKLQRSCSDTKWQCSKPCNKPYACGFHKCNQICHYGECGVCPNSGMCSCPCGANQRYVECPDVIETCVSTCEKKHVDCDHNCPEKCHKGPCPPCQVVIDKQCHCASHIRSLPCSKDFRCETKCRGIRPCNKHTCGKKCCNGYCPQCEKTCDKALQCGRHKCLMICHSGPCYPCPLETKITCRCKETFITVPCGREKYTKTPKCTLLCKLKYKCGHMDENKHPCHFGDCPPCKAFCNKSYENCSHNCKAQCHVAVAVIFQQVEKPATPWEFQPPKKKIMKLDCPPCDKPVPVECFGRHEVVDQPCHQASMKPCGRQCGQVLPCTNHQCSLLCHLMSPDPNFPNVPSKCEPCNRQCMVPRPDGCSHHCCIQECHPGPCPSCNVLERMNCFCGLTELYIQCNDLKSATDDMLSCKQQCPKSLECGHCCKNVCHRGPCSKQTCLKKIKSYCDCGNLKRELACHIVKSGKMKVACDETCEDKKLAAKCKKEEEEKQKKEAEAEKNKREIAEYEWKFTKKRKNKERKMVVAIDTRNWLQKFWIPILSIVIALIAGFFIIY